METLSFVLHNLPAIGERTVEHLSIVSVAVGIAIVTGVPLGIAITQSQRVADAVLYLGSIVMTPSGPPPMGFTRVPPVAKGLPATAVSAPVVALIV